MAIRRLISLVCLAALPLAAATIVDVTPQNSIHLGTGDALRFTIPASNFASTAASLGGPAGPTSLAFQFFSAPVTAAGQFLASLESADGELSIPLAAPLSFASAWSYGSAYSGPVSTFQGSFSFSAADSADLFAGSGTVLVLLNTGAPVTVGLLPYTLSQDLHSTVTNGAFSMGARTSMVGYVDPPPPPGAAVPEPGTGALLLSGGTGLCLLSAGLRRVARRRRSLYSPGCIQ